MRTLSIILTHSAKWFEANFRESVKLNIKQDLYKKTESFNLSDFENPEFNNKLLRANSGMEGIFSGFIFQIFKIIESLVTILGLCWMILKLHWVVPIVILLGSLPAIKAQTKYNENIYITEVHQSADYRLMNYCKNIFIDRDAVMELRIFDFGQYIINKWKKLRKKTTNKILSLEFKQGIKLIVFKIINVFAFGISLIFLIYVLAKNKINVGEAIVVIFALVQLQEKWEWFVRWCGWVQEDYIRLIKDLFSFFDIDRDSKAYEFDQSNERKALMSSEIIINNVSFSYPQSKREVLKNINLKIKSGEKVVIVGENGSGKTTLIKLIMGYYQPSKGAIIVGNVNISKYPELLWHNSSALYQDYVKYDLTFRDNIGFGKIEHIDDSESIYQASIRGGAVQILDKLSNDLDKYLGPTFGGIDLSGGQWQKLATSRGFLRESDIYILDEPTSALDPLSESDLYKKYIQLSKGNTVIFISHRLGIARLADRIIVMKNGEIVEEGNHNHLIDQQGVYFQMWKTQSSLYKNEGV